MIVDDEKFVRRSIRLRIDWQKLNLKIVGEADNGKCAYEMIALVKPDIMLVDIKMPIVDGISLIREVKKNFSDIHFVILSGYDDFEYTKEAIKLGVTNYIKKPIDEKELEDTLLLIIDSLNHKNDNNKKILQIEEQLKTSSIALREKYLNDLIDGTCASNNNALVFQQSCFALFIVHLTQTTQLAANNEINRDLIVLNMDKAIEKVYQNPIKYYTFLNEDYHKEFRILLNDNRITDDSLHLTANFFLDYLTIDYSKFYSSNLPCISVSQICYKTSDIPDMYQNALKTLKCKLFYNNCNLFTYSDKRVANSVFTEYIYNLLNKIYQAIENINFLEIKLILNKIFSIQNSGEFSLELLETVILELANILNKIVIIYNVNTLGVHINEFFQPNYILDFNNLKELEDSICKSLMELFCQVPQFVESHIIDKIKQYIENNYKSELSLPRIAKEFYLNSSYLSQLFKLKTGQNISKYIEDTRIDKAKELLIALNVSVFDVAFHVGYNDANYFSKVFKKKTGYAPSKFQQDYLNGHIE